MNDIVFMSNNLVKFAQDESPPDMAFTNKLFGPKIRKDPLGTVLIIGYIFLACGDSTAASSHFMVYSSSGSTEKIMLTQLDCL